MLKTNELRLGNYVQCQESEDEGFITSQINVSDFALIVNKILMYNPIQLTEEWLIKFGFKKDGEGNYEEAYIVSKFYEGFYFIDDRLGNFNVKPIHYVHEFQNLYFALTGVELELSSNVA